MIFDFSYRVKKSVDHFDIFMLKALFRCQKIRLLSLLRLVLIEEPLKCWNSYECCYCQSQHKCQMSLIRHINCFNGFNRPSTKELGIDSQKNMALKPFHETKILFLQVHSLKQSKPINIHKYLSARFNFPIPVTIEWKSK